jgi:hypothetical protein
VKARRNEKGRQVSDILFSNWCSNVKAGAEVKNRVFNFEYIYRRKFVIT